MKISEIQHITVLSQDQCQQVLQDVYELKSVWLPMLSNKIHGLPFYTLGAASYLAFSNGYAVPVDYYDMAKKINPQLRNKFDWLYSLLQKILEDVLKENVHYNEAIARPGFHIFQAHPACTQPIASIHCDRQFENINFGSDEIDTEQPISFTLSIELPACGAGLLLYDQHYTELLHKSQKQLDEMYAGSTKTYHAYRKGDLVIHSGYRVHQIAPAKSIQPNDQRVTLQGHAIKVNSKWIVYW